jgi:hypothetical protein
MHNAASMNSDIKALLALLLLKSGANAKDIQTALQLAAASRVMVAEENADEGDEQTLEEIASNVSDLRASARDQDNVRGKGTPSQEVMNSDIKALLTLLLLRSGTSSTEIQTTLRFAAASRVMITEELAEPVAIENEAVEAEPEQAPKPARVRSMSPRQALRAEHLAPVPMREFAA